MRDAGKLACRLQRHGGGAVAGDSGAIGMTAQTRDCTQRHFVGHLLPAQGLGVPCAAGINDRRVTHKVCWVNVPAASRRPRRAGTSTVAAGVPPCQPRERSRFNYSPGHFVSRHCRESAVPDFRLPSGTAERNAVRVLGTGKPEDGRPWSSSDGLPDQSQRGDKSGLFWEWSALERSLRSGRLAKRPKAARSWSLLPALHRAQPRGAIAGFGRTKSRGYCFHFRRYPEGRAVLVAARSDIARTGT